MPTFTSLLAGFRRALHRPLVRRGSVAVVAALTGIVAVTLLQAGEQARAEWGDTDTVVVAARDLAPGDLLDSAAVDTRDLPQAVVTDAALREAPLGSVVRNPIRAGEPLISDRLAPEGVTGTAALIPEGHSAVAVPVGQLGMPPLVTGDVVEAIVVPPSGPATLPAGTGHDDSPPFAADENSSATTAHPGTLLIEARVLDVTEQVVTLVVPSIDAATLAHTAASGVVVVTLTGR